MYSTCLFCNRDLGANELVESFPVGRRLAFDAAKGRLWVICTRCERWNLSPLEERWEAIEECERLFRDTKLRVSTDNVGLARLAEGLTLVRIGEPQRPEMAAWRYGDQFGRRRRSAVLKAGAGVTALGGLVVGGITAGVGIAMFGGLIVNVGRRVVLGNPDEVVAHLPDRHTELQPVRRKDLQRIRLNPPFATEPMQLTVRIRKKELLEYRGDEALHAAGALLPALNRYGGSRRQVSDAVRVLEQAGEPQAVFAAVRTIRGGVYRDLHQLPYPLRLAMEMAAHEETERRALEGELSVLEAAWKQAEEIAAISDSLLVPASVESLLARLRGETRP